MPVILGSNIASLKALKGLRDSNTRLSEIYQRLSTGMRINSAADDAAGLAVSSLLNSDQKVMAQAVRNANDGLSLMNIRAAALEELSSIATRIGEIAEQAANGSYSTQQREMLDLEAQQLLAEFTRIKDTASYNGIKLLDGSQSEMQIQLGSGSNGQIAFSMSEVDLSDISVSATVGDGTFVASLMTGGESNEVVAYDLNGDGHLDKINTNASSYIQVRMGNGDGTFGSAASYNALGGAVGLELVDLNNDGNMDVVVASDTGGVIVSLLNNGNGTFGTARSAATGLTLQAYMTSGDFNEDGNQDVITAGSGGGLAILFGNGAGAFAPVVTRSTGSPMPVVAAADFNNDNNLDLYLTSTASQVGSIALGNGNGTFGAFRTLATGSQSQMPGIGDVNGDGRLDLVIASFTNQSSTVHLGNGDGTFALGAVLASGTQLAAGALVDLNEDGNLDYVVNTYNNNSIKTYFGNGDGSFAAGICTAGVGMNTEGITLGDFNEDGVMDILSGTIGDNNHTLFLQNVTTQSSVASVDVSTQEAAQTTLSVVTALIADLSQHAAQTGAVISRLEYAMEHAANMRDQYAVADSAITNADIAEEVSKMIVEQIKQNAAAAILAQANQQPSLVLTLLGIRK